jgi:prephenate dehydrogenase
MSNEVASTVTIVGFGRFGHTLYRLLKNDFKISLFDINKKTFKKDDLNPETKVLDDIKSIYSQGEEHNHTVFFAVPIDRFEEVIYRHKRFFSKNHILIDVLSVKMHPKKVLTKVLREKQEDIPQAILTHPMFGPDSSKDGFKDLPLVMNQFKSSNSVYNFWKGYLADQGLEIVELTPNQHDQMAANSQGVTHFIGRLLDEFGFKPTPIDTLGAQKLQKVMEQTCNDTMRLFKDLQNYNPFTKDMRVRFGNAYQNVNDYLLPRTPDLQSSQKKVFGIQGGKGSFNEQALQEFVEKNDIKDYEVEYLYTTQNVLEALKLGKIDYGQFAVHNSVGGIVEESIQAMSKYNFSIEEEFAIIISHFMMKPKNIDQDTIDTLMSHPQVLKQCKNTLEQKYPDFKKISGKGELIDHAQVAKAMSEGDISPHVAVIGPEILSEIYDLEIIDQNLQDSDENLTYFLLVKRD